MLCFVSSVIVFPYTFLLESAGIQSNLIVDYVHGIYFKTCWAGLKESQWWLTSLISELPFKKNSFKV